MKMNFSNFYNKYGTIIILLVMVAVVTGIEPKFIGFDNIMNIFKQVSINGLIAFGMTFVILTGGIDLSVGAIVGLTGMVMGLMINNGTNEIIAMIAALVLGAILGYINGFFVANMKLQAFIVTLATMTTYAGITLLISDARPASGITKKVEGVSQAPVVNFFSQGEIFGLPFPMILMFIMLIILMVLLHKTKFGRGVYAIGGNEEVARLSSIPTNRYKRLVYTISGFMASLAGIILVSRLSSAQPTAGDGFELDAIAAVVIGGTSLAGGKGRIFGTFIGVLIIGVLNTGLNLIGISSFWQQIIKGLVILGAVLLDRKGSR